MEEHMKQWIAALALAGAAAGAAAGQLAAVSVINQSTGERLQVWRHEGRNYVAGNPGERYAIEVRNKTGGRILAVISVDGVNVVSGQTAAPNQGGYVLGPHDASRIAGWRKSLDEVAAFYFTELPDTYAARTGRPENAGVIGVALFREYVEPPIAAGRESAAPPMAAAPRAKRSESADEARIGTGHGERIGSATRMTDFRRASAQPAEIITIQYDTRARLAARGIIPQRHERWPDHRPMPFPGSFVPDPS
jgi:hypothetical protein